MEPTSRRAEARAEAPEPAASARPSGVLERAAVEKLLELAGDPPIRVVLWDGRALGPARASAIATVRIRDRATLYRVLLDPQMAFGEAYTEGRLEVEGDLPAMLTATFNAKTGLRGIDAYLPTRLLGTLRPNDLARSRRNVHRHYDLGNDFYALWLDERMLYTCAYFPSEELSLEQAQLAKMDHVARKLWLKPGERVLEVGCGWGALALHLAQHYGVHVRAFNVSREQIAFARERARREGLEERVEFVEDDYREASGSYDAFVSVGMLEHVGKPHFRELARVIDRTLAPHGRGLLHSLGRNRPMPPNPWLERHIFPGHYMPALEEMVRIPARVGLSVLDVENLRLHYARTVESWLDRFEKVADRVAEERGEAFVRMWRFYLAGSIASFRAGTTQLFQVTFARPRLNELPATRAHLYREG